MNDTTQKQIAKLETAVTNLQKLVTNLVRQAQLTQREIRTLKAKNESLNYEISRLSSKISK
jgi:peptidoglycan hydrolase CwlO-like protein